jgi:hypothetical protein
MWEKKIQFVSGEVYSIQHYVIQFVSGEVYSIQHYVIKFVSNEVYSIQYYVIKFASGEVYSIHHYVLHSSISLKAMMEHIQRSPHSFNLNNTGCIKILSLSNVSI